MKKGGPPGPLGHNDCKLLILLDILNGPAMNKLRNRKIPWTALLLEKMYIYIIY